MDNAQSSTEVAGVEGEVHPSAGLWLSLHPQWTFRCSDNDLHVQLFTHLRNTIQSKGYTLDTVYLGRPLFELMLSRGCITRNTLLGAPVKVVMIDDESVVFLEASAPSDNPDVPHRRWLRLRAEDWKSRLTNPDVT